MKKVIKTFFAHAQAVYTVELRLERSKHALILNELSKKTEKAKTND